MIAVNEVPQRHSDEGAVDILSAISKLGTVREAGSVGIYPRVLDQDSDGPDAGTAEIGDGQWLNLVVVLGPTGVGKTVRALDLARKVGAPIIVLDRVQCYAELAVGSARDYGAGQDDRIFLDERRVVDGMLSAAQAYRRLCHTLEERRAEGNRVVVLEGGSTSLIAQMAADSTWRRHARVSVRWLSPGAGYRERLSRRVKNMLSGTPSMVDEVRALWPDPRTHAVLAEITGYREVIAAMRTGGTLDFDPATMNTLIEDVTAAHVAYSQRQRHQFSSMLPLLGSRPFAPRRTRP
ncbi:hypothetical protein Acsp02_13330 [Actinoplanes sp. NBRC 103695]|nr:hypothetical protein Acsp02_13330 [Actinoplanes sp. NBRC 103695]